MKNQESTNRSKTVIFQLFEVEFAPISQPAEAQGGLFPDVPNANPTANPLEALGAILSTHTELTLPVVRKTKKGSVERKDYHADVLRSENNVTLLQPENLKVKKTILHRKENTHEHHPFCNVVVDLRNGHPLVGIERSAAFDGKPQKVADIMSEGLTHLMKPYGHEVKLMHLKKANPKFTTVVQEVMASFGDRVTGVNFDFNGDGKSTDDNDTSLVIKMLQAIAKAADAEALVSFVAKKNGAIDVDAISDQLAILGAICVRNPSYVLTVKFERFGTYRFGAPLYMELGLEKQALDDFWHGQMCLFEEDQTNTYALTVWLDRLQRLLTQYTIAPKDEPKHKRRRRR